MAVQCQSALEPRDLGCSAVLAGNSRVPGIQGKAANGLERMGHAAAPALVCLLGL